MFLILARGVGGWPMYTMHLVSTYIHRPLNFYQWILWYTCLSDENYPIYMHVIITGEQRINGPFLDLEPNLWDKYSVSDL